MIRIYLDWNVISSYKRQEYAELRNFVADHKDILQFPYPPTHFKDLMKSYSVDNKFFDEDLENLNYLAETHLLQWGKDGIEVLSASPKEYFDIEKNKEDIFSLINIDKIFSDLDDISLDSDLRKIGTLMKELLQAQSANIEINDNNKEILLKMFPNIDNSSSMWDLMEEMIPFSQKMLREKEFYKDLRKSISDQGFKLEANSGNWNIEEVIRNINVFLQKQTPQLTFAEYFAEYIDTYFEHKKEPINRFEYYTTAYLLLDMIGYKSDKLPKPTDSMQNIQNDAEHSFYSGHCDYFVAIDKNLLIKTKVLFKEFNISTIVLTPSELIQELGHKIHKFNQSKNFLEEPLSFLSRENLIEDYEENNEYGNLKITAFKLPVFYFNFFNYSVCEYYLDKNVIILTFKRVFKNYSRFIFYTDADRLIERISTYFGAKDKEKFIYNKNKIIQGDKEAEITWEFLEGTVVLKNDVDTHRPTLLYFIPTSKE